MLARTWSCCLITFFFVLPCINPRSGLAQSSLAQSSLARRASSAVRTLQQWYVPQSGLYQKPTDWWNAANAITALVDYSRITHDNQYLDAIDNTFRKANAAYGTVNFVNDSNDDAGWWALAWIDAYDLTHRPEYLRMAQTIFADLVTQWDTTTCGGGIWWSKNLPREAYKNAVTNEIFLSISASLANRVSDSRQRDEYLAWAHKEWQWFQHSGMINSDSLINDGLDSSHPSSCVNNRQTTWTYNQGVILGGIAELYRADRDPQLLSIAGQIAHATIAHLTTPAGILNEPPGHGPDWPQFKGIFLRNLARLGEVAPDSAYKQFADTNAESLWRNDRKHNSSGNDQFGQLWQGPFDSADATRQTSGLDVLLAALAIQRVPYQ